MKAKLKEKLESLFVAFIRIYVYAINFLNKLFSGRRDVLSSSMLYFCKAAETNDEFPCVLLRPKNNIEIPILERLNQMHNFAIILQGPICLKDNMTANTVLFYRKVYPTAKLIISTWDDESQDELSKLAELGAIVVTSERPNNCGFCNVNLQLTSSLAGVKKAKELGCEFAVKTRTDQRICKPFIFDFMISSVELFPGQPGQEGRICTLDRGISGMFVPYHCSDFLYLGYTEDLIKLFSVSFDKRSNSEDLRDRAKRQTRRQASEEMLPPEVYIMKNYCINILGLSGEDTVEEWWNVNKNYLISFGKKDVDLIWNKYGKKYDYNFNAAAYFGRNDSSEKLLTMCFDWFNWFNLYLGNITYDKTYERYADAPRSL